MEELARAFFLIFAAEMGDKTQIMAMTFATQYKKTEVLTGVFLGVILNHGIAIVLGRYLSKIIPLSYLQIIAGIMFVIFGLLALTDEDNEEDKDKKHFSPVLTVAIAFFLGELGDKTQLTALTLSTESNYPLFILLGTTLGMVVVSGLGIIIGSKVGEKIPEVSVKIISSLVFLFFGTYKLMNTIPEKYLTSLNIFLYFIVVGSIEFYLFKKLLYHHKIGKRTALKEAAAILYKQTQELKLAVDEICLGEEICGQCKGSQCLIGHVKGILKRALEEEDYYDKNIEDYTELINKDYNRSKLIHALSLIILYYEKYGIDLDENFVVNKTRKALEIALFNDKIEFTGDVDKYLYNIKKEDLKVFKKIKIKLKKLDQNKYD